MFYYYAETNYLARLLCYNAVMCSTMDYEEMTIISVSLHLHVRNTWKDQWYKKQNYMQ